MDKSFNKHDHALAKLAIQLSEKRPKILSKIPSSEELAAFYDKQLDEARRQEVLEHIANNEVVYRKWINLVESMMTAESTGLVSDSKVAETLETSLVQEKISIWKHFSDWWEKTSASHHALGGGFVVASVVVLTVVLVPFQEPSISDDLDGLYKQYGASFSELSAKFPEKEIQYSSKRNFAFSFPNEVSERTKILQTGFIVGSKKINIGELKKWGYDTDNMQTLALNQVKNHTEKQFQLLSEAGRFTALTAIPCQINPENPDAQVFYDVGKRLSTELNQLIPGEFFQISQNYLKQGDKAKAVCEANIAFSILINDM